MKDPSYVSKYSVGTTYTLTMTRVKWNDVGFYYDEDGNKVEGWAMYTDDVISALFGVGNPVFPTRVQERDDMPGYFRLINTYGAKYPYNDPGDWDESKDYYIYIDATDPEKVWIPNCNMGVAWSTYGFMHVYSMVGLGIERDKKDYIDGNYGTYANGKITFPKGALLFGMENYKDCAWYTANAAGAFSLVINPDLDLYTASIKNDDFTWEKVFSGTYMSAQLNTNTPQVVLYKGVAKEDVEAANPGCYTRFADQYGTVYKIGSPYAEGYDLVFCVKKDEVVIPEGFESQPLGFKGVGYDIYGAIAAGGSTFTEDQIDLKINFQDASGKKDLGTSVETLLNFIYTKDMVLGTFNYSAVVEGESIDLGNFSITEDPDVEKGIVLNDFYLEGSKVPGTMDLDGGKIFIENFAVLGIEKDEEGTPYYILTYNLGEDERGATFYMNMDGKMNSDELILVGTPDGQNLYYWVKSDATIFTPVKADASASRRASAGKFGHKGAKLNAKLSAKVLKQLKSKVAKKRR